MLRRISIDDLRINEVLTETLFSEDGVLLLRKGLLLTERHTHSLRGQGYSSVYVRDEGVVEPPSPKGGDAATRENAQQSSPPSQQTARCLPYRPDAADRIERLVETTAEMVGQLSELLIDEELMDGAPFQLASERLLEEVRGDQDQTLHQVIHEEHDRNLARRCTQLSVLSMSIAVQMALDDEQVTQIGSGALLHDLALFGLPEEQRVPSPHMTLETEKMLRIHPALAERLLETVRSVDLTVRAIVVQTHEQLDGSGFPRGLTARHINKLARVVNLADAYLTLTQPGLGRTGMLPADAIAYLMHHACGGRFDPSVMKGLLRAVSLYPIGSLVQLSDNSRARVLRAQGDDPQQPVVLREDGPHTLIDLKVSSLRISQPLVDAAKPTRRLVARNIDQVLWGMHAGS